MTFDPEWRESWHENYQRCIGALVAIYCIDHAWFLELYMRVLKSLTTDVKVLYNQRLLRIEAVFIGEVKHKLR